MNYKTNKYTILESSAGSRGGRGNYRRLALVQLAEGVDLVLRRIDARNKAIEAILCEYGSVCYGTTEKSQYQKAMRGLKSEQAMAFLSDPECADDHETAIAVLAELGLPDGWQVDHDIIVLIDEYIRQGVPGAAALQTLITRAA